MSDAVPLYSITLFYSICNAWVTLLVTPWVKLIMLGQSARSSIPLIFNISIARFYICILSSAHYNYSRIWREADRGRLWAYKWRFKQPLLVHTSLMICPLTHPAYFPCGGSRSTRRNPTTFGRALTFTLFTWGLGSSHIEKFSLRFEPATLEVKGKCANRFATEAFDTVMRESYASHARSFGR
jgi:hypothetical protein